MGAPGLEPGTSALSGPRSNRLSYAPKPGGAPKTKQNSTRPDASGRRGTASKRQCAPPVGTPRSGQRGCPGGRKRHTPAPLGPDQPASLSQPRPSVGPRPPASSASPAPPCDHADAPPTPSVWALPRKEVIQPQLPLRLPCYDFVPITSPTLDGCRPEANLQVGPPASGVAGFRDVTGGVYKAREHIHRSSADPRLLATPASRGRVAAPDPN